MIQDRQWKRKGEEHDEREKKRRRRRKRKREREPEDKNYSEEEEVNCMVRGNERGRHAGIEMNGRWLCGNDGGSEMTEGRGSRERERGGEGDDKGIRERDDEVRVKKRDWNQNKKWR